MKINKLNTEKIRRKILLKNNFSKVFSGNLRKFNTTGCLDCCGCCGCCDPDLFPPPPTITVNYSIAGNVCPLLLGPENGGPYTLVYGGYLGYALPEYILIDSPYGLATLMITLFCTSEYPFPPGTWLGDINYSGTANGEGPNCAPERATVTNQSNFGHISCYNYQGTLNGFVVNGDNLCGCPETLLAVSMTIS